MQSKIKMVLALTLTSSSMLLAEDVHGDVPRAIPGVQQETAPEAIQNTPVPSTPNSMATPAPAAPAITQAQAEAAPQNPYDLEIASTRAKLDGVNSEIDQLKAIKKINASERNKMSKLVDEAEFYRGDLEVLQQKKQQIEAQRQYQVKKAEYDALRQKAELQQKDYQEKLQAYQAQLKSRDAGSQTAGRPYSSYRKVIE